MRDRDAVEQIFTPLGSGRCGGRAAQGAKIGAIGQDGKIGIARQPMWKRPFRAGHAG
jgi:hypothetical protein